MKKNNIISWLVCLIFLSSCSYRLGDFTAMSSKNNNIMNYVANDNAKRVKGGHFTFLFPPSLKEAMDEALESAGPGYDLLVDGVVYLKSFPLVLGYVVKGTAVRTKSIKKELGQAGFEKWLNKQNATKLTYLKK